MGENGTVSISSSIHDDKGIASTTSKTHFFVKLSTALMVLRSWDSSFHDILIKSGIKSTTLVCLSAKNLTLVVSAVCMCLACPCNGFAYSNVLSRSAC